MKQDSSVIKNTNTCWKKESLSTTKLIPSLSHELKEFKLFIFILCENLVISHFLRI